MAQARPASVRQSSVSSSQRAPFERLLDRRLQSVSTFVSSTDTQSEGGGASGSGGKPQKVGTANSARWSEEMPQAVLFPANKPTSRADAAILDKWITSSFASYAQRSATEDGKEIDLIKTVEELVPVLSIGLHELVRQVTQHCLERGVVLEKIWRTYVELFDRVLRQMQESLRSQKQKTQEVQRVLQSAREDLQEVRRQHPKDMHRVISELEAKFTRHQQDSEDALNAADARNKELKEQLRKQHKELELWYPGFHFYQDSYIRNHIPNQTRATLAKRANITTMQEKAESLGTSSEAENEDIPTEVAIAEDFKRLLAVLAPDKRRTIGKELAVVLEGPSKAARSAVAAITGAPRLSAEVQEVAEEDTEALEQLKAEVNQQEERIAELRAEIARFESEQRLPTEVEAALAATAAQAED
mmetsp:Transcript_44188/g.140764  ORF Transcript_44188/g.140764 Transcript_44188/m.140764 type:complete len:416 (-) Transcript_44188:161-1408(-)